jgi:sigma-E factor negative regulatory protein RseA
MKEQLSAFVDNELSEFEERRLLSGMAADPELRETWERYHLIRAVLRNELDLAADPALAERVTTGLRREGERADGAGGLRPTARVAGTLAIAASVAALAIVGLYTLNDPANEPAKVAAAAMPGLPLQQVAATRWSGAHPDTERTLNTYLAEHNEYAATTGMGGVLPYIRAVGYESTRDK